MEASGLEGVGELLDGGGRVAIAYGLVAKAGQNGADYLPVPNPLARTLSFQIVHNGILPHVRPSA